MAALSADTNPNFATFSSHSGNLSNHFIASLAESFTMSAVFPLPIIAHPSLAVSSNGDTSFKIYMIIRMD